MQLNEDVWAFNSTLEDNRLTVVKTIPVSFWSKSWTRTRIDQPTCMTQLHQMRFYTEKFPVLPVKLLTLFRDNLNTCSHVTYTGNCWSWPSHSWVECLPVVYHSEHQLDCTGQDGWQRVCIVSRFGCLRDSFQNRLSPPALSNCEWRTCSKPSTVSVGSVEHYIHSAITPHYNFIISIARGRKLYPDENKTCQSIQQKPITHHTARDSIRIVMQ